jgi:replicative DNA helicase
LHELDLATLGLVSSELYVLAACTSIGKTTLMMQVAHQVATQSGPVLFVS